MKSKQIVKEKCKLELFANDLIKLIDSDKPESDAILLEMFKDFLMLGDIYNNDKGYYKCVDVMNLFGQLTKRGRDIPDSELCFNEVAVLMSDVFINCLYMLKTLKEI
jgi:hypothetical protein